MTLPLRVVFFGSPDFAVPALEALAGHPELAAVVACVTQSDKPTGRGQKLSPPPVKVAAAQRGISVLQPKTLRDPAVKAELAALGADLFVVAAYGKILPPAVLQIPRLGCVNLHASLLPKYRGAAPIAHALLGDETETGVCLMQMEEGLDTGPVYARVETPITAADDAGALTARLAALGAQLLVDNLRALAEQDLVAVAQPPGETYAGKIKKEDGHIDWSKPTRLIWNQVRAFSPWPAAFAFWNERRLQILRARPTDRPSRKPGTLFQDNGELLVATGDGVLELLTVKPEGKRAMTASEFLSGRPGLPSMLH